MRRIWLTISRKPVEAGHDHNCEADNAGGNDGQKVKTRANCHTDRHCKEDKAHVAGLLDRIPKANDRERAPQARKPGNVEPTINMTSATTMPLITRLKTKLWV